MGKKQTTYGSIQVGDKINGRKVVEVDTVTRGGSSATRVRYEGGGWNLYMASGESITVSR